MGPLPNPWRNKSSHGIFCPDGSVAHPFRVLCGKDGMALLLNAAESRYLTTASGCARSVRSVGTAASRLRV